MAGAGHLKIPGDGRDLISLVHIVDMARAAVAALEHAPGGSLYHIVDDGRFAITTSFTLSPDKWGRDRLKRTVPGFSLLSESGM